ncbi:uncharacterized protein LOC126834835 isoform X2 [Adelges cooleyi]|uniref:uncharacterized protein LOC126834835 isoform X2 n=1 Tax=Adelges cooleyi TaxID=133065 RepID=UPI00217FED99|nr:uncharacterized protein LOC126834835 isoform X2 [Adelges cooleyi]
MVNDDDITYEQLNLTDEENMLDGQIESEYEAVTIDEQDVNNIEEYEESEIQEVYDTDIGQSDSNWRHNEVRYLIYCWCQIREQFSNCPENKKKALWQALSERMLERGYFYDAQSCENKWRYLKKIYLYNKTRLPKQGSPKCTWEHYDDMDRAIKGIPLEPSGIKDSDKCYWSTESTKALIQLYGKDKTKFASANQGDKHLLWEEIAHQLVQLGYRYAANSCNDKWRNLKMSYKKNKLRALKYGAQHVKWYYYKDMDSVLKDDPQETSKMNDIIMISMSGDNEFVELKKEDGFEDEDVDFQTPEIDSIENIEGEPSSEVWTEAATKQLIQLWGMYRSRFLIAAQGKKQLLWNEISEALQQRGHNYSGTVCDRKWRLLKANYLKRKEKYKKFGVHKIKWQYYQDMDRLLRLPSESVAWTMDSTVCLIESFDRHKDKFMKAATGEKLLIWRDIANEMMQNGYSYTPRACDNKWRTLKNRYNKNRMRVEKKKKVVWIYYDIIDSIVRELNKDTKKIATKDDSRQCGSSVNSHTLDGRDLDEHDYNVQSSKQEPVVRVDVISEIKEMFQRRNTEFDQRLKQMEDNLTSREKVFENLQYQTLEALKKSNELETQKLKLLQQLVSRLPV